MTEILLSETLFPLDEAVYLGHYNRSSNLCNIVPAG